MSQQLVDDLIAARERLRGRWTKGRLQDGDGNVCAAGACRSASTVTNFVRMVSVLEDHTPGGRQLVDFNDDPATTEADVIALFDRAIEAAKAAS